MNFWWRFCRLTKNWSLRICSFFHTRVEVKIVVWCRIFLNFWNQGQIAHIYTFLICSLFPLGIEKILFCLKFAQIKSIIIYGIRILLWKISWKLDQWTLYDGNIVILYLFCTCWKLYVNPFLNMRFIIKEATSLCKEVISPRS